MWHLRSVKAGELGVSPEWLGDLLRHPDEDGAAPKSQAPFVY